MSKDNNKNNTQPIKNSTQPSNADIFKNYASPQLAAGFSFPWVYRAFEIKSHKQIGKTVPPFNLFTNIIKGIKTGPTVGGVVGSQIIGDTLVNKLFNHYDINFGKATPIVSSGIIGIFSVLPLVVLNGQTMGLSVRKSLNNLSSGQAASTATREGLFVAGVKLGKPAADYAEEIFGDNEAVRVTAAGVAGGIGTAAGHAADTTLTWLQDKEGNGKKLIEKLIKAPSENGKLLMRGFVPRTFGGAVFAALYAANKEAIDSWVDRISTKYSENSRDR
jgi:hypothetical protein